MSPLFLVGWWGCGKWDFSKIPIPNTQLENNSHFLYCPVLYYAYLIVSKRIVFAIFVDCTYTYNTYIHTWYNSVPWRHAHALTFPERYCNRKHILVIQNTCPCTRIICLSLFLKIGILKSCIYWKPPCGVALNEYYWHGKRSHMHNAIINVWCTRDVL